ncbi:MAG: molybdopterin molybdotransferase MoeA [Hydrogenibacillus schlegelii]|uniref:Molybdopterin molybdenumtransferase n=1 Tax=Hydrogenibacillus schlegelii TaxID=1484 RepID=A0A947GB41_HYDSH|nr:molybdopterin molybdotransferase MoeA [Hydrogenibacillus schlegelii]
MIEREVRPIPVEEARRRLFDWARPRAAERRPLLQAFGRYLAEAPALPEDVPPFDRALKDGFAVRAAETEGASPEAPVVLRIAEEVPAGGWPKAALRPGTAVRIMTGAPLPAGADAVVPVEDAVLPPGARGRAGEVVHIVRPTRPGAERQPKGGDLRQGSAPVEAGARIGPAEAAVLATAGAVEVAVVRLPRVALAVTGDELVTGAGPLRPGQIRNSNGPMLRALFAGEGFRVEDLGRLPDATEDVVRAIGEALEAADVVVTTGAVSVGDYDVVPEAMARLRLEVLFRKVAIKPGMPLTVAVRDDRAWIALPGNPASSFVTTHLFVLPLLRKMAGARRWEPLRTTGRLIGKPAERPTWRTRFWRAEARLEGGAVVVDAGRSQTSASISSFLGTNAFVEVPPEADPAVGETVTVWWIGGCPG